eukprot:g26477.t1
MFSKTHLEITPFSSAPRALRTFRRSLVFARGPGSGLGGAHRHELASGRWRSPTPFFNDDLFDELGSPSLLFRDERLGDEHLRGQEPRVELHCGSHVLVVCGLCGVWG